MQTIPTLPINLPDSYRVEPRTCGGCWREKPVLFVFRGDATQACAALVYGKYADAWWEAWHLEAGNMPAEWLEALRRA